MNDSLSSDVLDDAPQHHEKSPVDSSIKPLKTGSEVIAVRRFICRVKQEITKALGENLHFYDFLRKTADFINAVEDLEKKGKEGFGDFFERFGSHPALLFIRDLRRDLSREFKNKLKGLSKTYKNTFELCEELNFKVRAGKPVSDDEFNTINVGYRDLARDIAKAVSSEIDKSIDDTLDEAPQYKEGTTDYPVEPLETGSEVIAAVRFIRQVRQETTKALGGDLYYYDFLETAAIFINAVEDLEKKGKEGLGDFFKKIVPYPALLCSREHHRGLSQEFIDELKGLSDKHQITFELCDELNFKVRECKPISDDEFNQTLESYKNLARDIERALSSEIDRLQQADTE